MDTNRFDNLARSIASWTSRRRFAKGLAAGAAGGILGWRQVGAQDEEEPTEEPVDISILSPIAEISFGANFELLAFQAEVEAYRVFKQGQLDPTDEPFDPYAFDERFGDFIDDLIALTDRGSRAAAELWTSDKLADYLSTLNLVVRAISAGGDTDAQLHQYALSVTGGEATPVVTETCNCIDPIRVDTCAASCLDVWTEREQIFTASGDMVALVQAFYFFVECFIWKESITATDECLSTLIDPACAALITCGCSGNCN